MSEVDNFLEHYGKKGMRWGVRKSGGSSKTAKKKSSTKPDPKKLSDDDLRKAVNRMQLEKQYTSLVNGSSSKKGSAFAKEIGKNVVKTAITTVATQQVASALKKAKLVK